MGKKFDFATTLTETQSYIGEAALPYVTAAFLKNRTADSGVKIVEDIIKYAYVAKLTASNVVQKGDHCNFSPAGTITAGEVKLEPCPMWIDIELCYKDLEALWNGLNNGNMNTQEAGADFNQALQGVLINAMNIEFEKSIWAQTTTGTTGTTSCASFSGIPEQITNKVTGATLTASNIVAAVDALVAALPANILQDLAAVKIYMNPKNALYYKQALMKLGLNTPADIPPQTYAGMPIVAIIGMDDKLMVAIQPQNIALGVSAMDNFSQLVIKDMRESTLDNKVRMKLQGKVDVKVIYPAEAAKYA